MKTIFQTLEKDKLFSISLLAAATTSVFVRPELSYINFKVLILLFNLMLIISALKDMQLLDKAALCILEKCSDTRTLSLIFIVITFFASMLVTNDVALLTFVPLCIITFKKTKLDPMKTIIFQTLAANIGSSLTPMGNPQNLFLFAYYKLSAMQFFSVTIPFVAFGMLWLFILNKRVVRKKILLVNHSSSIKVNKRTLIYILLFSFIVFSVFGIVDYKYTLLITLLSVILLDKQLIARVDYFLLGTFICFFIFIGNISNISFIKTFLTLILQKPSMPYISSILLSQVVSNVPCSILVSSFTSNWKEVLLGVNTGGMGTIIASLASVISYKIYIKENQCKNRSYLLKFNIYNIISLFVFTIFNYLCLS